MQASRLDHRRSAMLVLSWGYACCFAKRIAEVSLVTEVELVCDLTQWTSIFHDQFLRVFNLHLQNELIGAQAYGLFEKSAEVVSAEMNQVGQIDQSDIEVHGVVSKGNDERELAGRKSSSCRHVHGHRSLLPQ